MQKLVATGPTWTHAAWPLVPSVMNPSSLPVLPRLCALACAALSATLPLVPAHAADVVQPETAMNLFNGTNLSGWVVVGRDNDPAARDTWSVQPDAVLRATGEPFGYIRTAQAYRNYQLRIEWRWVSPLQPVGPDGKARARNSGVLLHRQGEDKVWPRCLEAQLQENNAGDFIAMDGATFTELQQQRETAAAAATDEAGRQRALTGRRVARQREASENRNGEWNVYLIECRADTVALTVNGVPQNKATGLSVTEGHICLQSEGAPIEFRKVVLAPLD